MMYVRVSRSVPVSSPLRYMNPLKRKKRLNMLDRLSITSSWAWSYGLLYTWTDTGEPAAGPVRARRAGRQVWRRFRRRFRLQRREGVGRGSGGGQEGVRRGSGGTHQEVEVAEDDYHDQHQLLELVVQDQEGVRRGFIGQV
eukprot:1188048-Prorocentrum_minimum.AAC.1